MDESLPHEDDSLEGQVARAKSGDRSALESVIHAIQQDVFGLAMRFLWHPQDAEDATQEILIRVITGLGGFRGESAFRTWVYRIACNALLTMRKKRMERDALNFEQFSEDLHQGLVHEISGSDDEASHALLLEEVKIGCTLAMLQCLDRDHRLAYILGEIMELNHVEATQVLATTPATFRKRLSRARKSILAFMHGNCGLVNADNGCRCHRRVETAVALGRVDPSQLLFASSRNQPRRFPEVLSGIRHLDAARRAAALYRSHPEVKMTNSFNSWLKKLLDESL